jgi:hypothetical protein
LILKDREDQILWFAKQHPVFPGIQHVLQANEIILYIAPPPSIGPADENIC